MGNANNCSKLSESSKIKIEELAYMMAQLPEQKQAQIYYMLLGAEIFGKPFAETYKSSDNNQESNT